MKTKISEYTGANESLSFQRVVLKRLDIDTSIYQSKSFDDLTSLEHDAGVVYGIDDIKDENIVYFYIPIVPITEFISDLIRTYINTYDFIQFDFDFELESALMFQVDTRAVDENDMETTIQQFIDEIIRRRLNCLLIDVDKTKYIDRKEEGMLCIIGFIA